MSEPRKGKKEKIIVKEPPVYDVPPPWIPPQERWNHANYNSNLITFLPRSVTLKRIDDGPLGFNVRGGPITEYGVYVSKVSSLSLKLLI